MRELYSFFNSSAAYRVRIALGLKGLDYRIVPVDLLKKGGGEQRDAAYLDRNPAGLVPVLVDDRHVLTQSLAIIEYLDEVYRTPPLLPPDPVGRARVRALALSIAADIHPLNNLRVLRRLAHDLQIEKPARDDWYRHWVMVGFQALEAHLRSSDTGRCCHGDDPGLADCCLIPQVHNARRLQVDMAAYPNIERIAVYCGDLPAFRAAHPDVQPDAHPQVKRQDVRPGAG